MIKQYDTETHTLRRKGAKREYKDATHPDGTPVLDYFHPHIRMRASEYARTRKVYDLMREMIKRHFGVELKTDSDVYRHYLLLMVEHCAREIKIEGDHLQVVTKMMLPLPKSEWIKAGKKSKKV